MTAFELRMYPRALEELQAALDDPRRPLPPEIRAQVASLLQQTRAFVGSYRVERSPPEATLWVDGAGIDSTPESALILAVGVHELRASALGYAELRQTLHVQGREDQTLYVRLEPLPAASTLPPVGGTDAEAPAAPARGDVSRPASKLRRNLAYTAFGLGAAALIASAVTGGLAVARKQTVKKHCPSKACEPPWWDERNELLRFANASTATLAVGAVGIGLGAYFWLTRNARGGAPRPGHISLSPGFGRLSVYGRF